MAYYGWQSRFGSGKTILRKIADTHLGSAVIHMAQGLVMAGVFVGSGIALRWMLGLLIPDDSPAWDLVTSVSITALAGCAVVITLTAALEVTLISVASLAGSIRRIMQRGDTER